MFNDGKVREDEKQIFCAVAKMDCSYLTAYVQKNQNEQKLG